MATAQKIVAKNESIHTIFFEDSSLCYNYKTGQWTRFPAISGRPIFSISSEAGIIGAIIEAPGYFGYQDQSGGDAETATITTGEFDLVQGERTVIDGIRPLVNGGTVTSRVGVRDSLSDSVSWATGTSVNARTGMIHYRNASTSPEGRYVRAEFTIAGGFTTAQGADVDFEPSGRV